MENVHPSGHAVPGAATGALAYRTLLILFNAFLAVIWLPGLTTLGDTDVGAGAVLLALMTALLLLVPSRASIDDRAKALRRLILLGIGALLIWAYLGIYISDQPLRSGRLILSFGQGIILVLIVSLYLSPRALRFSLGVNVLMLSLVAVLSLYAKVGGGLNGMIFHEGADRASGFFKNPNQYGMVCALITPLAVVVLCQPGRRLLGLLILGMALLGLLLSASKTNLIVAMMMMLLALGWCAFTARRGMVFVLLLPLLALSLYYGSLPVIKLFNPRAAMLLDAQISGTPGSEAGTSTVDTRLALWRYSIDAMRARPVLGEGAGQRLDLILEDVTHSHNVFLDLGRTTGVVGLALGIILCVTCLWLAITTLHRLATLPAALSAELPGRAVAAGVSFAIVSYLLSNQMSDSFGPSTSVFFWLCVGLALRRHDVVFGISRARFRGQTAEPLVHPVAHPIGATVGARHSPGARGNPIIDRSIPSTRP